MKKVSLIISIIMAATCFSACGSGSSSSEADSSKSETTTTSETATTTTTTQPTTTTTTQATTTTTTTTTTTEQTEPEIKKSDHFVDSYLYVLSPNNGQVNFFFGTRNISGKPAKEYVVEFSLLKANGEPANATYEDGENADVFGISYTVGSGYITPYTMQVKCTKGVFCTTYERIRVNSIQVTFEDGSTETIDPQLSEDVNKTLTFEQAWEEKNKKHTAYFNDLYITNPDGSFSARYKWMEQNSN